MKVKSSLLSHLRKSDLSRSIFFFATFAIIVASIPAHAQNDWQIDSQQSYATLSLGSGDNASQVGLARVTGDVDFRSTDIVVAFRVASDSQHADYSEMIFRSARSAIAANGKLIVTGDLTITRVERSVTANPSEAYSGAEYGEPVASTTTRQITLTFPDPRRLASQNQAMHLAGISSMHREDFPQFLEAMSQDQWPTQLVNDEHCSMPSNAGEDYAGAKCTGTVIASVENAEIPSGTPGAADYSGFKPAVDPDTNTGTIALNLRLTKGPGATVASRQVSG